MDYKIEVIVVPVTDIDRAKAFYSEQLGFTVDVDDSPRPDVRIVQLTPPGSGCSVVLGKGMGVDMTPGRSRASRSASGISTQRTPS